jgi:glycosyltransferase involved in cell wall biosynthesis
VFVLPSLSEQWGMVLNEAACAGLPLVASDAAGAAWDLVEDGVNGFRVPAGDIAALREALRRLVDDAGLRASAGRRSAELGAGLTPARWAEAVAAAAARLATAGRH